MQYEITNQSWGSLKDCTKIFLVRSVPLFGGQTHLHLTSSYWPLTPCTQTYKLKTHCLLWVYVKPGKINNTKSCYPNFSCLLYTQSQFQCFYPKCLYLTKKVDNNVQQTSRYKNLCLVPHPNFMFPCWLSLLCHCPKNASWVSVTCL